MKIKQAGFVSIALIAVVIVLSLAAAGGYVVYSDKKEAVKYNNFQAPKEEFGNSVDASANTPKEDSTVTSTHQVDVSKKIQDENINLEVRVSGEITQEEDCGSENCFQEKYAACEPAMVTVGANAFATYSYKIIGPTESGCKITMNYPVNPNPDWVGKEMTCTFNNKADFKIETQRIIDGVVQGTVTCDGPLYDLFRNL